MINKSVNSFTCIVSVISPGSQVVRDPVIIIISLLACDGNSLRDFIANSKEFCKDGSPANDVCCKAFISYKNHRKYNDRCYTLEC